MAFHSQAASLQCGSSREGRRAVLSLPGRNLLKFHQANGMKPVGVRGRTAVMVLKQARSLRENTCCAASLAKTNYLGLGRHGLQRLPRRKETCSDLARAREPGPGQPDRAGGPFAALAAACWFLQHAHTPSGVVSRGWRVSEAVGAPGSLEQAGQAPLVARRPGAGGFDIPGCTHARRRQAAISTDSSVCRCNGGLMCLKDCETLLGNSAGRPGPAADSDRCTAKIRDRAPNPRSKRVKSLRPGCDLDSELIR